MALTTGKGPTVLDVLTTALESAAVLLLVVASGWMTWLLVDSPLAGPAALTVSGAAAWASSAALQRLAARAGGES